MTEAWRLCTNVTAENVERGVLLRHGSRPDLGELGVVVPRGSPAERLLQFLAEPRSRAELEQRFPGPQLGNALRKLASAGLLFQSAGDEQLFVAQGHTLSIARLIEEIDRDLQAFGPALHEGDEHAPRSALATRLAGVRAELERIRDELRGARAGYLEGQLRQLGLAGDVRGLKLHLGCGGSVLESWVNVDTGPAPLRLDLRWGLPFPDGSAEYVYAAHLLEDFYYKDEALRLLQEIHRVLASGGVLRLVVPDIEKCLRAYVEQDEGFFEARKRHWPWAANQRTRLEQFLEYAGAGARPYQRARHRYGYDFETLALLAREAGFARVVRSEYMQSEHAALRVDDHSQTAGFRFGNQHYSLFVEAGKEQGLA